MGWRSGAHRWNWPELRLAHWASTGAGDRGGPPGWIWRQPLDSRASDASPWIEIGHLTGYRRFVEQWPRLPDWFAAPLPVRLGFEGGPLFASGRTAAHRASSYLVYLALVRGVGLDADYILGRKYARLLSDAGGRPGRAWAWTRPCSSHTLPGSLNSATSPRMPDRT